MKSPQQRPEAHIPAAPPPPAALAGIAARPLAESMVAGRGIGVILFSSVLFGAMAVCVRVAAREMPAAQIAFIRFSGAFLVLMAFSRGHSLRPRPGNLPRVLLRGLLGACAIFLYFRGIQGAGAGFATLLHCTYPIYTTLIAIALLGERFSRRTTAALVLNVTGAFIMLGPAAHVSPATMAGGLNALAASVLAGGAVAAAQHLRATESALLITVYFMGVGSVLTAPFMLSGMPPLSVSLCLALLGTVLTSVAAQVLLHHGLGFARAPQGALACATSVVSAAVFEAVFLGETLSSSALAGATVLLAAVALAASK